MLSGSFGKCADGLMAMTAAFHASVKKAVNPGSNIGVRSDYALNSGEKVPVGASVFSTEKYLTASRLDRFMKNNIVILVAHDDDNIFGAGGTLIKYADEGKDISTIIFSYGEGSHFLQKEKITKDVRKKEWAEVARFLNMKKTIYLGLQDTRLDYEIKRKNVLAEVKKILKRLKPDIIFTHSLHDPHPDHKAVHDVVLKAYDEMRLASHLYTFDVWTAFRTKGKHLPEMYIDISSYFRPKVKALFMFRSQKPALMTLMTSIYWKAFFFGMKNRCKWAERFYKER